MPRDQGRPPSEFRQKLQNETLVRAIEAITPEEQEELYSWAIEQVHQVQDAVTDAMLWAGLRRLDGELFDLDEIKKLTSLLGKRKMDEMRYGSVEFQESIAHVPGDRKHDGRRMSEFFADSVSEEVVSVREKIRSLDVENVVSVLTRIGGGLKRRGRMRTLLEDMMANPESTHKQRCKRLKISVGNSRTILSRLRQRLNTELEALVEAGEISEESVQSLHRVLGLSDSP